MGIRRKVATAINAWRGPLPSPKKWVFIVGCYNSGTTLLHSLLAQHPKIGSMPDEGQFFTDQLLLPKSVGFPRLWALKPSLFYLDDSAQDISINKLKRQWGARYNEHTRPILIEKSPTNAARTLWLQKNFENAHFVGLIRNGYAVAEGIHRKAGHTLGVAATQWLRSNEIMLRDFNKLRKKKIIRYEELTTSTEKIWQEILIFLDLPHIDLQNRVWNIHEQTSVIKNMNHRSLSILTSEGYDAVEKVAGKMLNELGYMRDRAS